VQNLRPFQIRDIIMINKTDKMIETHDKDVKDFKKVMKKA